MTMSVDAAPLRIGWASRDITPQGPCGLGGQFYTRIAERVRDPLMVTAWAAEAGNASGGGGEGGGSEQVVMASLDVLSLPLDVVDRIRRDVGSRVEDLDPRRIIINVTHTHSAPPVKPTATWLKSDDTLLSIDDYVDQVVRQTAEAIEEAWRNRAEAYIGSALAGARIGHCRRALYADGRAEMYGRTDREDFRAMEAGSDSGVETLFCWDSRKRLTGIILNVACPSQVMEASLLVTADFAGEARRQLRERFGQEVFVLPQISAAGDLSPRDLTRSGRDVEPDMWHEDGAVELGRRLAVAVTSVYDKAQALMQGRVPLDHRVETLALPVWRVSEREYEQAREAMRSFQAQAGGDDGFMAAAFERYMDECRRKEAAGGPGPYDSKEHDFVLMKVHEAAINRYSDQDDQPALDIELHTVRLGDLAFATNPFELFLDYGLRIKSRSPARQTFLIQLACGSLGYLPTAAAAANGGYGATALSAKVGPEGGEVLVDKTVDAINALWEA